ncbi:MAG: hypothetical protein KC776_21330 [Myxococcales bacterium]|nr:hypothetical protein [Myxococcales bacterium]MCB9581497.1 hypothetical protein [Polyangiaceae bacterium]
MQPGLHEALGAALQVLHDLGLRYALVGGLAVSAWAVPRATRDADLWVDLEGHENDLVVELRSAGFDVPAMAEELENFGVFRSRHVATGVFIDMFNAVGPLGKSILDRRKQARLGEHDTWLASAEDVAVLKAFSDRPRDLDDLVALLQVTPLDLNYVSQWAERLDASIESNEVSERLRSARAKAKH